MPCSHLEKHNHEKKRKEKKRIFHIPSFRGDCGGGWQRWRRMLRRRIRDEDWTPPPPPTFPPPPPPPRRLHSLPDCGPPKQGSQRRRSGGPGWWEKWIWLMYQYSMSQKKKTTFSTFTRSAWTLCEALDKENLRCFCSGWDNCQNIRSCHTAEFT